METDYYNFCFNIYSAEYNRCYNESKSNFQNEAISETIEREWDKNAQKSAIKRAMIEAITKFEEVAVGDLWKAIYQVHLYKKSGISDVDIIQKVISADQSWKKSSGHAFEEMIKELSNLYLSDFGIEVVLQRDLNILLKAGEINNEPRDISWLKEQVQGSVFDLYCTVNDEAGKKYCFGCIQCKTSIRDRVTRDREPSLHAMKSFFWSVAFVLDGDFLRLQKFRQMVNGGSEQFPENGWHGMYVLSEREAMDRIYPLSSDFAVFVRHAQIAAIQWLKQRQWFNEQWKAE